MLGAIIGDVAGSRFEWNNNKNKYGYDLFVNDRKICFATDDSIMSLAIARAFSATENFADNIDILKNNIIKQMKKFGKRYPNCGFGGYFHKWVLSEEILPPYNSFGNGSAMRVSPCAWAANSLSQTIQFAKVSAEVTHNHPEGIKGAEAVAAAIYLSRLGKTMKEIKKYITENYYKIDFTLEEIREKYTFDVTCQGSVPQALQAFFESVSFEDAIRNAISIGGDSDTIAAITGSIAEAYYGGIPPQIKNEVLNVFLDNKQKSTYLEFASKFIKY